MIINADARLIPLKDKSVHCAVTSPPYWGLRNYNEPNQIGLERTPEEYVSHIRDAMREVWRVLRDDGTLWLNLGDSYSGSNGNGYKQTLAPTNSSNAGGENEDFRRKYGRIDTGLKPKDLVGIPWMVAFALRADGWYLRRDIIWYKPNPMPESVTDRPTTSHEYIFLLSKSRDYYYDAEAIREKGSAKWTVEGFIPSSQKDKGAKTKATAASSNNRTFEARTGHNKPSVWTVPTEPYPGGHYATFPTLLVAPCVLAGCPKGGTVLDPFCGSGTVGEVCRMSFRNFVGVDISIDYLTSLALPRAEKKTNPASLSALPMFSQPK